MMKTPRLLLLGLAAAGLYFGCQSTDSSPEPTGPQTVTVPLKVSDASRIPDSLVWRTKTESGIRPAACSDLACPQAFALKTALGATDTFHLELWQLGIREAGLRYLPVAGSNTLVQSGGAVADSTSLLALQLLASFRSYRLAHKDTLVRPRPSDLVNYYAVLLLDSAKVYVAGTVPTGMSRDSLQRALVLRAGRSGWTAAQLVARGLPGIATESVRTALAILVQSQLLPDTTVLFPPGPRLPVSDTTKPTVVLLSPVADSTIVPWETRSALLAWSVTDDSALAKVTLDDSTIASGSGGAYQKTVPLLVGRNLFTLIAMDARGNRRTYPVVVVRQADTSKPALSRAATTRDTILLSATTSLDVSWSISDNALKSVTIDDVLVSGKDGTYARNVVLDSFDDTIRVVAIDSTGNESRDAIAVRKLAPPAIHPDGAVLSPTQTSSFTLSSNLPGASLEYSYDTTSGWSAYTSGSSVPITSSKLVFARAKLGSAVSGISSAGFLYRPTFAPGTGSYPEAQSVLVSALGGPSIQYKIGEGDWAASTGPASVLVSVCGKLYARSLLGGNVSNTDSATYVFAPTFDKPTASTYVREVPVAIASPGADSIQYRKDQVSAWTKGSSLILRENTTLYARSWFGGIASNASTATYLVKNDTSLSSIQVTDDKNRVLLATITGTTVSIDSLHGHTRSVTVKAVASDAVNASVTINGGTTGVVTLSDDTARIEIVVSNGGYSLKYSFLLAASRKDTLIDPRDKQSYKVVKIGSQWWMAQNLNYRSETGENVDTVGSCYENAVDSCSRYGRLYNWVDAMYVASSYDSALLNPPLPVRGICPKGWHVPTDSEWIVLVNARHASTLAAAVSWSDAPYGTDSYGFSALPAGIFTGKEYRYLGKDAWWWTLSESSATQSWMRRLDPEEGAVVRSTSAKSNGFSLRCIEN